ncbi:hypothetical protein MSAN_01746300 [Mycena sanguinolenta]|uniref:Secreted protein n=1 Tax=Mycena sanguinolenta TaxID=230812 RepID=A0A8H6XX14_9AGAR|nr:hypothetical protein MSAN_01746300 [Mycena sanguinolenta]
MLPLLFSASLCSTSPAVFLERVTVPVCATRLTPATTVSDTAPRYLRVPPGLSTPESMAPRPDCRVRCSWSPVCETEGGHDLQVMSSLHLTHRMAFLCAFSFTRLDVSQRVVALGGQQVAGIQLLGALTFSSRPNGDVLKKHRVGTSAPK